MPAHKYSIGVSGKFQLTSGSAFKVRVLRPPVFPLRASEDNDSKGGPLGNDSDMIPRESIDPSYFVFGGILGKSVQEKM